MTYIDDAYPEELDDAYKQPQHFPMTLNKAQFEQFVCNYVQHIVEGLDVEQLAIIAFDLLVREYETYTEEKIVGEIEELYGEEFAQDLVESVSGFDSY